MIGFEERVRKKKRGRKGMVYATEPQSRPHLYVGKCARSDPKITR